MTLQLSISISGPLGDHLDTFRELLALDKRGRLSDDWDQEFGSRILQSRESGWIRLDLSRYEDDKWGIRLTYERDPLPADEVEELRRQILEAAAAVGVTVTAQTPAASA
ncbi:hypothetical protein [Nonomuraea sp. NPDC003804]|uniref:hypothetical protein n=1 Tax=Nonomuraea sp. NPDC003804 TaxID=3154547 RepID=UPI0033BD97DE